MNELEFRLQFLIAECLKSQHRCLLMTTRPFNEAREDILRIAKDVIARIRDIEVMLDAAIKRCNRRIEDEKIREAIIEKFTQAKNRLADWVEDEDLRKDVCPKCQIPSFLCGCLRDPFTGSAA